MQDHVPAALSSLYIHLGLYRDINKRCCTTSNWNSSRRTGLKDAWHVTEREREAWENQQRTDTNNSKHRYTSTAWAAEGNFFLPALSGNYKWILLFCEERTQALYPCRNDVGLNTTKWYPVVSNATKYEQNLPNKSERRKKASLYWDKLHSMKPTNFKHVRMFSRKIQRNSVNFLLSRSCIQQSFTVSTETVSSQTGGPFRGPFWLLLYVLGFLLYML